MNTNTTTDQARKYLEGLFDDHIGRHDFKSYIRSELAGDFACVLAEWLVSQSGTQAALAAQVQEVTRAANTAKGTVCADGSHCQSCARSTPRPS